MFLMVPDLKRRTSEWVIAPCRVGLRPSRRAPLVTPVAETKTFSPATKSAVFNTWFKSYPESSLHGATETFESCGGDHAFGRSPDAHQQVDPALRARRGDSWSGVTVRDDLHPRPRFAQFTDKVLVPVPR